MSKEQVTIMPGLAPTLIDANKHFGYGELGIPYSIMRTEKGFKGLINRVGNGACLVFEVNIEAHTVKFLNRVLTVFIEKTFTQKEAHLFMQRWGPCKLCTAIYDKIITAGPFVSSEHPDNIYTTYLPVELVLHAEYALSAEVQEVQKV